MSHFGNARTLSVFPQLTCPRGEKGEKKSLSELLHYSFSLSERLCFDCGASVPPNKPNTSSPQVVTENMLTVAIKLNKLTKLCKQHSLRAFISKHAVPCSTSQ